MSAIQQMLMAYGAAGGGGGSDPYVANRVLSMHFDGSNGSTTFTDYHSHSVTRVGSTATISTAQAMFGQSLAITGATEALTTPHATDLDFTTGDWTIRFFIYMTSGSGTAKLLINKATGAGQYPWQLTINSTGKLLLQTFNSGGTLVLNTAGTTTVSANAWHHIEACRSGSNFYAFLDGTVEITGSSAAALRSASDPVNIGGLSTGASSWPGYIDELQMYKGVAIHTANFTPQSSATPD
jgi:hypothetical protein